MDVIIGLDESGNGAIAGPVIVAAAAYLASSAAPTARIVRARSVLDVTPCDSKKMRNADERSVLAQACQARALSVGVCGVDSQELDTLLVAGALRKAAGIALRSCVERVQVAAPDYPVTVIVDGRLDLHFAPRPGCRVEYVTGADASRWQVSAASLIARSTLDAEMTLIHDRYPAYGFARHAGYATREHLERLRELGPCPAHRRTFRSIMEVVGTPPILSELWS